VTELQGSAETIVCCHYGITVASITHQLQAYASGPGATIAVYAWLGATGTDRAPNGGFYSITSLSAAAPNQFYDYENPVGGVVAPTNKLEILTPYLALAALVIAASAVVVVKRRRD
jgi:hypothetical protein